MRIAQMIWWDGDKRLETDIVSQNLAVAVHDSVHYSKSILVLEDRGVQLYLDMHEGTFDVVFLPDELRTRPV